MLENMNLPAHLLQRQEYVEALQRYLKEGGLRDHSNCLLRSIKTIQLAGKHIIWMDEMNVQMFRRRVLRRYGRGSRAGVARLPCSKGPSINVICAISDVGAELVEIHRGTFKRVDANDWIGRLATVIEKRGTPLNNVVLVCDNSPAHSSFEEVAEERGFTLLHLSPYSPMLNPIESIWSGVKASIKRLNSIPVMNEGGGVEERHEQLEAEIRDSIGEITTNICCHAIKQSRTFHRRALAMEDMPESIGNQ